MDNCPSCGAALNLRDEWKLAYDEAENAREAMRDEWNAAESRASEARSLALEERGWLIEGTHLSDVTGILWWHPRLGWMPDANNALRFARKSDAADFMREYKLKGTPTEHAWPIRALGKDESDG